jgi:hypothetical protein
MEFAIPGPVVEVVIMVVAGQLTVNALPVVAVVDRPISAEY